MSPLQDWSDLGRTISASSKSDAAQPPSLMQAGVRQAGNQRAQPAPAGSPITAKGVAKAGASGVLGAAMGMAHHVDPLDPHGYADDADFLTNVGAYALRKTGVISPEQAAHAVRAEQDWRKRAPFGLGATTEEMQRAMGLYHEPGNWAERLANTIGVTLPGAALGGEGLVRNGAEALAANTARTALASQAARVGVQTATQVGIQEGARAAVRAVGGDTADQQMAAWATGLLPTSRSRHVPASEPAPPHLPASIPGEHVPGVVPKPVVAVATPPRHGSAAGYDDFSSPTVSGPRRPYSSRATTYHKAPTTSAHGGGAPSPAEASKGVAGDIPQMSSAPPPPHGATADQPLRVDTSSDSTNDLDAFSSPVEPPKPPPDEDELRQPDQKAQAGGSSTGGQRGGQFPPPQPLQSDEPSSRDAYDDFSDAAPDLGEEPEPIAPFPMEVHDDGSYTFKDFSWLHPDAWRPQGPMKWRSREDQRAARDLGNKAIVAFRKVVNVPAGHTVHHADPIFLGGNPEDQSRFQILPDGTHQIISGQYLSAAHKAEKYAAEYLKWKNKK
jgi:hypothetical protein